MAERTGQTVREETGLELYMRICVAGGKKKDECLSHPMGSVMMSSQHRAPPLVWSHAPRHQMSYSEVMTVLEAVQTCTSTQSGGMPLERFRWVEGVRMLDASNGLRGW